MAQAFKFCRNLLTLDNYEVTLPKTTAPAAEKGRYACGKSP